MERKCVKCKEYTIQNERRRILFFGLMFGLFVCYIVFRFIVIREAVMDEVSKRGSQLRDIEATVSEVKKAVAEK